MNGLDYSKLNDFGELESDSPKLNDFGELESDSPKSFNLEGGNFITDKFKKLPVDKVKDVISKNAKEIIQSLIAFIVVFIIVILIKKYVLKLDPAFLDTALIVGGTILTKPIVSVVYNKIT